MIVSEIELVIDVADANDVADNDVYGYADESDAGKRNTAPHYSLPNP